MWQLLGHLPYNIAVVPRHPFPNNFLDNINIPDNIDIINQVGILKSLCSQTSLTVMGKIFSDPEGEMEHSPLEATINSNAISGYYSEIEDAYKEIYMQSGLIHRFSKFSDSLSSIPELINDPDLKTKLELKKRWLDENRKKYMDKIFSILLNM